MSDSDIHIEIGDLLQNIHLNWLRLGSERLNREERESLLKSITARQWELMELLEKKWAMDDKFRDR